MGKMNELRKHLLYLMIVYLLVIGFFTIALADQKGRAFHVGEVVQGDIYGINVIKAEIQNEFEDMHGRISPSQSNHKLLVLEVRFYENGNPLKDKTKEEGEILKLSIIDARGRIFPTPLTESNKVVFRYILYGKDPKEAYEKEGFIYQVFFSVPKNSSGFKLQYRNLPQVSLGL